MSITDEPRVYPRHIQQCGYCLVPGARNWFKLHNLDWRDFMHNGIAFSALEGIDDALCESAKQKALEELANG